MKKQVNPLPKKVKRPPPPPAPPKFRFSSTGKWVEWLNELGKIVSGIGKEMTKDNSVSSEPWEYYKKQTQIKNGALIISPSPWKVSPLNDWSICGMNHHPLSDGKFLFVSMVKDGICITEEGRDDKHLWTRLCHKANDHS